MAEGWALVDRYRAGDRTAVDELYREYHPMLFRFAYNRIRHREVCEDVVSDAWIRILRGLSTVDRRDSDLGAWMVTIVRNLIADYYKSARYKREWVGAVSEVIVSAPHSKTSYSVVAGNSVDRSSEGDPEGTVTDYLMDSLVAQAVRGLTPEQARCIVLRFYREHDVAETAAALDCNVGAVKALQYRAVRALARALGDNVSDAVHGRRVA